MDSGRKKASGDKRVLIVEDDSDLRELLLFTLEDEGYTARGAGGAIAAIKLLESWPCHLVVSDVRLGGLDGLSCLKVMKERHPQLKTVVMTGYAGNDSPSRALDIAVDDYLYKPFDLETFQRVIHRVVFRAEERAFHAKMLSKILGGCHSIWNKLYQPWVQKRLAQVAQLRERCFGDFFVGVRSGGLSFNGALLAWDRMEELEDGLGLLDAGKIKSAQLEEGYRYVIQFIAGCLHSGQQCAVGRRRREAVGREDFKRFLLRLRRGTIAPEQLPVAMRLRRCGTALSGEERELFDSTWGAEVESLTPWALAQKNLESGAGVWGNLRAHFSPSGSRGVSC